MSAPSLRVGDTFPTFTFTASDGSAWSTDGPLASGNPTLLILHRHLA